MFKIPLQALEDRELSKYIDSLMKETLTKQCTMIKSKMCCSGNQCHSLIVVLPLACTKYQIKPAHCTPCQSSHSNWILWGDDKPMGPVCILGIYTSSSTYLMVTHCSFSGQVWWHLVNLSWNWWWRLYQTWAQRQWTAPLHSHRTQTQDRTRNKTAILLIETTVKVRTRRPEYGFRQTSGNML